MRGAQPRDSIGRMDTPTPSIRETTSEALVAAIRRAGSNCKLAYNLGVAPSTIGRWLKGEGPCVKWQRRIDDYLRMTEPVAVTTQPAAP